MDTIWSTVGVFIILGLVSATAGVIVAPMLGLPRVLLAKYELRKVRLVTHRIDAPIRERAIGSLSHPEEDEKGNVSLPASRS